jgi:type VI protein secretion system component Hcp
MAIDGYMAFKNYGKTQGGGLLKSESQVVWNDSSSELNGKGNYINFANAAKESALFEIEEWSFGVERVLSTASQSGGIGTGSATFNPFSITRKIDRASPTLFEMSCSGSTFERVSLGLRKAVGGHGAGTESGKVYLRYDFKLVGVKTINWSHAEDSPTETVEFEYGAVQIRYAPQQPNGDLGSPINGGWNRIQNVQDTTDADIANKK